MANKSPHIIVLAAGQGKRMISTVPKVLHEVLFHPLIEHVVATAVEIAPESTHVVVGKNKAEIGAACKGYPVTFVDQPEPLGTGHAVLCAKEKFSGKQGDVLVLNGDVVALRPDTLKRFLDYHRAGDFAASLMSMYLERPTGYGRILKQQDQVTGIREEKDASQKEREIQEVNCGVYLFKLTHLFECLEKIASENAQKEYYLTDTVEILTGEGQKIGAYCLNDPREALGINNRKELFFVENYLQQRVNSSLLERGITLREPQTTRIDPFADIEADVEIEGGVSIRNSKIRSGCKIEAGCRISDSELGEAVTLKQGSYVEGSEIGEGAQVGPYAHLRPDTKLGKKVRIGNFVELKKAKIGEGSKASHLSYIGDAELGADVNIGCGFITCNYDGKEKHKTTIGDRVFVGSDSQTVAPVTIESDSYVASGTTVTKDVPSESLAIARTPQENRKGLAKRLAKRKGK